jgi:hypothetical protein
VVVMHPAGRSSSSPGSGSGLVSVIRYDSRTARGCCAHCLEVSVGWRCSSCTTLPEDRRVPFASAAGKRLGASRRAPRPAGCTKPAASTSVSQVRRALCLLRVFKRAVDYARMHHACTSCIALMTLWAGLAASQCPPRRWLRYGSTRRRSNGKCAVTMPPQPLPSPLRRSDHTAVLSLPQPALIAPRSLAHPAPPRHQRRRKSAAPALVDVSQGSDEWIIRIASIHSGWQP